MGSERHFQNARLLISAGEIRQFPGAPVPQVALSGRSNVGKSSLINTLLGRKALARVSGAPGKTVTVNFYDVDGRLFFVDLPGYGYAKRSQEDKQRWSRLTDGYFTANPRIDLLRLVVQLSDSYVGPTADDRDMLRYLRSASLPHLIVATKADKLNATQRKESEEKFQKDPLCSAAAYHVWRGRDAEDAARRLDGFYRICMALSSDFASMLMMDAMTGAGLISEKEACERLFAHKSYKEWSEKHGKALHKRYAL